MKTVLRTTELEKDFKIGEIIVHVLRGVNIAIDKGEVVAIVGPSGSGKSTLLGLLGGLDLPTSGCVEMDGVDISIMKENELAEIRNEKIGFVFQAFNLIPTLTALENVSLPIQFARKRAFNPTRRARELLEMLELGDRLNHRPTEMSGGEQQRVAIARALANNPLIILADEPTGNLDSAAGELVMKAFERVRQEIGTTLVMVTHDKDLATCADRIITLWDGQVL